MKRYLACLLLVLTSCSHFNQDHDSGRYLQLVIVGTNDVHGYIRTKEEEFWGEKVISSGAEWFAGYIRNLEHKYGDRLILMDGGDIFQGTLESNTFKGKSMMAYYNLLPYRAAAIGNHEFDYGPETKGDPDRLGAIKARMREAKFPFLSANIGIKPDGRPWKEENLYPTTMFEIEGIKIGVIGLTTETTPQKTRPQNVASLVFHKLRDMTVKYANKLRDEGADLVLIVAHEGGDQPWEPMPQLLASIPQGTIDAVVSGHTHTKINTFLSGVPVIQALTRNQFFGRIDLYVDRQTKKVNRTMTKIHEPHAICGTVFKGTQICNVRDAKAMIAKDPKAKDRLFPLEEPTYEDETVVPDFAVKTILAPYFAQVDQIRTREVGRAVRDFKEFPSGESETGNFLTDLLLLAYPEAKVAYYNGGGIRKNLSAGIITYGDMFEVMPFDNTVVLAKVKGKELRRMLELGTGGEQKIPALSGVTYEYTDSESTKNDRDLNGDGKMERWERNRLRSLKWKNGKPVRDNEEFWLITNDFLLDGGDRMGEVFGKMPRSRVKIEDVSLLDAIVNQIPNIKGEIPSSSPPRILVRKE